MPVISDQSEWLYRPVVYETKAEFERAVISLSDANGFIVAMAYDLSASAMTLSVTTPSRRAR